MVLLEGGKSVVGGLPNTISSGVVEIGEVFVGVCNLAILVGEDSCLDNVGKRWLDVPVRLFVLCIHLQQFVSKGVVISLEAWGGGPLALLLRVGKVGVFSQILTSGGERGWLEGVDKLVIGLLPQHVAEVRNEVGLRFLL